MGTIVERIQLSIQTAQAEKMGGTNLLMDPEATRAALTFDTYNDLTIGITSEMVPIKADALLGYIPSSVVVEQEPNKVWTQSINSASNNQTRHLTH